MSDHRIYNFSSGPAMLPIEVLERARDEMLSFRGSGMSVMEVSHRSDIFQSVLDSAERRVRQLLDVPENYRVLFLQGGARLQFSMVPMNFLTASGRADYVITGAWGQSAVREAERCGRVNIVYSGEDSGFTRIPAPEEMRFNPNAAYIHYTSNETIHGVEFKYDLEAGSYGNLPVICDACSNIMSKPIDVSKYALLYAGAQKNIGPSGVTLVIVRDDMMEKIPDSLHSMLSYSYHARHGSMANTPNTWGIYIVDLVCEWLQSKGGLAAMQHENEAKAALLYNALDNSDGYFRGHAERSARSVMNVTFRLPTEELEKQFCAAAESAGFFGLKGHRSVGGIRASIYNAFPRAGVEKLVRFMSDFSLRNG
jgi:phosphoserine aminotransferase